MEFIAFDFPSSVFVCHLAGTGGDALESELHAVSAIFVTHPHQEHCTQHATWYLQNNRGIISQLHKFATIIPVPVLSPFVLSSHLSIDSQSRSRDFL